MNQMFEIRSMFKDIIMDELWYTLVVLYMGTMGFAIGFLIGLI